MGVLMDGLLVAAARAAILGLAAFSVIACAQAQTAGDPVRGATVFKVQCAVCHHAEKGAPPLIGPSLFGVVGRKAGTTPGFAYSNAMKNSGLVWSSTQLATYLKAPMTTVAGTKMTFVGLKRPGDAEAVAAYLATLK